MVISLIIGGLAIYDKLAGNAVDGFTTVILLILMIGSILMISVGLIGVYIGKIYDEIKRRPSYLIDYQKSNIFK
jgi:dolichol-phosphate mannosyltransferase